MLRHATVLPMAAPGAPALSDHAVVVQGDSIVWLGPDAELPNVAGAVEVDATGHFVLPGLADLHVHASERHLPLFLANGVTTVRELNGSAAHLEMRRRVAAGELEGPRLFVSSPLLTGTNWSVRHVIVPDPDSASVLVDSVAARGYDWIKVYDGLSMETHAAIVAGARRHGLPVTGHIPEAVGLEGILAAGQDLEHVEKIAWVTGGMAPDPARIPSVVRAVRESGVRLTATLHSQRILTAAGTVFYDSLFGLPEMRYVDAGTRGWWSSLRAEPPRPVDPADRGGRIHAYQRALVLALHEAGVPILVGTDTPNPMLVPGFSLHDEMAALVDAGLPLDDVLFAATAGAGAALGMEGRLGVVRRGARADLLIVDADPRLRPATLREPRAVLAAGRLYRRADLERLLTDGMPQPGG